MSVSPPLYVFRFRVLVVKNEGASQAHQRVVAICLEQNLTGRGPTPEAALEELSAVVLESLAQEIAEPIPAYRPDPDPALLKVYEDPACSRTQAGDMVLRKLILEAVFALHRRPQTPSRRTSKVTYQDQECLV